MPGDFIFDCLKDRIQILGDIVSPATNPEDWTGDQFVTSADILRYVGTQSVRNTSKKRTTKGTK